MSTILVALELSPDDRALLETAKDQARAFGAPLHLVHVAAGAADFVGLPKRGEAEPAVRTAGEIPVGYAYDRQKAAERLEAAHADLEGLAAGARKAGLDVKALLLEGATAERIVAEAARQGARLIVLGSHQRGTIGEWLLGSVAHEVLRKAPCPVLVVPV
jgi:nucleotide-binding universal stress UspA family protein